MGSIDQIKNLTIKQRKILIHIFSKNILLIIISNVLASLISQIVGYLKNI